MLVFGVVVVMVGFGIGWPKGRQSADLTAPHHHCGQCTAIAMGRNRLLWELLQLGKVFLSFQCSMQQFERWIQCNTCMWKILLIGIGSEHMGLHFLLLVFSIFLCPGACKTQHLELNFNYFLTSWLLLVLGTICSNKYRCTWIVARNFHCFGAVENKLWHWKTWTIVFKDKTC